MNDEIKMFIAGEEVVSQNEFTINEEMLSASSTILNNCYPKSWFVIGQGEYLHGNNEFEPLEITGKNLFQVNDLTNGIVKSYNSGEININGIITGSAYYSQIGTTTLKSGTYYFSFNSSVPLPAGSRVLFIKNGTAEHLVYDNTTVVISENVTYDIGLVLNAGTFLNVVLRPQIEFGNVKTSYEPYNQPNLSYETNVEKEWNSFNVYGNTYQETRSGINLLNITSTTTTLDGITYTIHKDKSITINGTNTKSSTSWFRLAPNFNLPAGTYTLSNGNSNVTYNTFIFYDDKGNIPASGNVSSKTFTSSIEVAPYIRIGGGQTINNQTIYPMIVEGSYTVQTLPTYEQYGLMPSPDYPSELVSVGYENLIENKLNTTTQNGITITKNNDGTYTLNGTATTDIAFRLDQSSWNGVDNLKNYDAGTYTFSCPELQNDMQLVLMQNETWTILGRMENNGTPVTFSTESYKNCFIYVWAKSGKTINNLTITPQLEKGNKAHSFIPYGKYGIEVKTNGKNLFNSEDWYTTLNAIKSASMMKENVDGKEYYKFRPDEIWNYQYMLGQFKENTQYTLTCKARQYENTGHNSTGFVFAYTDGTTTRVFINRTTTEYDYKITSEVGKTISYIRNSYDYNEYVLVRDIQLEEGTQATSYEPYIGHTNLIILDNPLRSIGDIKDKLYIKEGMLYVDRKIGSVVLDGSEDWIYPTQVGSSSYYRFENQAFRNNDCLTHSNYLSNNFKYNNTAWDIQQNIITNTSGANTNRLWITIDTTLMSGITVNDFKSWLSTHNTEVQYVLDEPTITPIGYVNMPNAYDGKNITYFYTGLDTRIELWYYWKNYDVLFAGVVKNSGDISLNPRHPHYCSLQILDYKTFLSESNTLDFVIANKTISEAISMVVNAVSGYGFIVGNIDIDSANDIIGAYSTLNKTAYDVLQYLAEISGSRWRARVVDSLTMAIDFYDPDTLPQAEDIEYTKEYWENNNIVDLTFNYGTRDYRNKQILLSDEVYANINYDETLISNGYSNTFTLQNNIGDVVSVVVDGAEKTIGTNNDKQMGVEADFYFTPGKNVIESNSVYSAGTMIHLTYQPLVKGRQIVYNNSEIDRISQQTQTEGVIARYETRNDVLSSDELEKIAKTYIEYKGKAEVILTLRTQNKDLYNIGEVVYFNAPISDLAQNYMVKSKKIEYVVINKIVNLFYIYELTSSFNNEKAINYFDNQRSKATGNIEEGESITRNVDIETQASIIWSEGSVSSASVTVTGDNVLNCALNSPFVE